MATKVAFRRGRVKQAAATATQYRLLKNNKFNSDKELTRTNLIATALKGHGYKLSVFGVTVPHLFKLHFDFLIFKHTLAMKIQVPHSLEKHTR